jgi:hypothetical protein
MMAQLFTLHELLIEDLFCVSCIVIRTISRFVLLSWAMTIAMKQVEQKLKQETR